MFVIIIMRTTKYYMKRLMMALTSLLHCSHRHQDSL